MGLSKNSKIDLNGMLQTNSTADDAAHVHKPDMYACRWISTAREQEMRSHATIVHESLSSLAFHVGQTASGLLDDKKSSAEVLCGRLQQCAENVTKLTQGLTKQKLLQIVNYTLVSSSIIAENVMSIEFIVLENLLCSESVWQSPLPPSRISPGSRQAQRKPARRSMHRSLRDYSRVVVLTYRFRLPVDHDLVGPTGWLYLPTLVLSLAV